MSRTGIVADVHSNLAALNAVIRHSEGIDEWWCVGDTVGYGPQPTECIAATRELDARSVCGNHDIGAAVGAILNRFNRDARIAAEWTKRVLSEAQATYLKCLPLTLSLPDEDALLLHGSPRDPVWEYVLSEEAAAANFRSFKERICFHGHSHIPRVFTLLPESEGTPESVEGSDGTVLELCEGVRYMVNAGSVGQPRDGDPRACYVVFDSDGGWLAFHRVEYDVAETQRLMEEAGLPPFLVKRIALGI